MNDSVAISKHLDAVIGHINIEVIVFNPTENFLQDALGVIVIVADAGTGDHTVLPGIMVIDFSRRDIEFTMQARQQGFEPAAFFFERRAAGKINMDSENT